MVKALINKVLGKDSENKASTQGADVPDELPSLAEDAMPAKPGGKVSNKGASASDEIPDELPEISKKPAGKAAASSPVISEKMQDIPPARKQTASALKERSMIEREIELMHQELNSAGDEAKSVAGAESAAIVAPDGTEDQGFHKNFPSIEKQVKEIGEQGGYFSSLKKVMQEQGFNEALLSQDLFSGMLRHWEEKAGLKPEGDSPIGRDENESQENLIHTMEELQDLEARWKVQKKILEEDQKYLAEKEISIRQKLDELQIKMRELKFHQKVSEESHLVLLNKVKVRSIKELMDVLIVLDDKTFRHHVHAHKNDFADWLKNSCGENALAKKIRDVHERHKLLKVFYEELGLKPGDLPEHIQMPSPSAVQLNVQEEISQEDAGQKKDSLPEKTHDEISDGPKARHQSPNAHSGRKEHHGAGAASEGRLSPAVRHGIPASSDSYFRLNNGGYIRTLSELPSALRHMDDATFHHHVHAHKNDFADWIRHVFGEEKLASLVREIHSRHELIDFLDIYL